MSRSNGNSIRLASREAGKSRRLGIVFEELRLGCNIRAFIMSNTLAPEPILRASLRVLHVAAFTTRNWTLTEEISRKQIHELWEAIHEIPDLIKRWRGDESLPELRMYLKEYDRRWSSPKLEEIFDKALNGQG
ncbi:MAG TPA: hypothetical protein VGO67_08080 [Verrucomicrobiae bacterium]|jgi:hypothetical protein